MCAIHGARTLKAETVSVLAEVPIMEGASMNPFGVPLAVWIAVGSWMYHCLLHPIEDL